MSAAIHTRYVGPRRFGSVVRAWTKDGKGEMALRLPYPHEMHHSERHPHAAKTLATRLGWFGLWIVGHNEDNTVSCAQVPGSFSRAWVNKYIPGVEGEDWFFVEQKA